MQQSLVLRAAKEFADANYLAALDLYRKLAEQLGERNFRANIELCKRRLRSAGRRDCSQLPLKSIKVACVMDEFTFHSYEPECNLFPLSPDTAINELNGFNPDLLFIESAWRGKDELWNRKISTLSGELRGVLQWCRERQIPTVFWNKEDPIHFETFLTTAQQFDYVFTTDIDCIARYKAALEHDRVYLLPFACQPKIHNPIELYQRKDAFCFAGAYYVRYPERTRDLIDYIAELPKFKPFEIFDRNFGKDDVNYQFPAEYQPYIVGTLPFNEIDKAYKGYRYAINLNSIKQSQTMFARRVFELLGSNTITVSNFSRGVRLLLGELVISSDNGREIVERLKQMDDEQSRKFRLAGLRKAMREHTYEQRLAYVAQKALGRGTGEELPLMVVAALAGSEEEYRSVLESYKAQHYGNKRLVLALKNGLEIEPQSSERDNPAITLLSAEAADETFLGNLVAQDGWLAMMVADDYYGPNYLLDLALATRYCDVQILGKAACYRWDEEAAVLLSPETAYRPVDHLPMRASAARWDAVPGEQTLQTWLERACTEDWMHPGLAIDPFNYCLDGALAADRQAMQQRVDDAALDTGLPVGELLRIAESIGPAEVDETALPTWGAARLQQLLGNITHQRVSVEARADGLYIASTLGDGRHEYFYAREDLPLAALQANHSLKTHLDATPGLDVQYVLMFFDHENRRLNHAIHAANRNQTTAIPAEAAFVRIGLRVCGSGASCVKCLVWGHRKLESAKLLARCETLLLTNHYPKYDDLYRNGFVHSRVKAYRERGVQVDVFRLRAKETARYHEFQNIDVVTGGQRALRKLLDTGCYQRVLVHFLSLEMWEVLEQYPSLLKIVWVHGAEIQPWHRRDYNYQNEQARAKAIRESEKRMAFWRGILNPMPDNLKLVFVSRYFAEEVFEDLGFRLPDQKYAIIHNPIDTELFSYQPKSVEQRKRVLSIRPYASRQYANDLSVKAILKLSELPCFNDMEFRIVGDGKLFKDTVAPLRKFPNITVEQRFLTHAEISALHKEYGVFLVPTRWDSHGVSRDEAMASGLVPITSAVAAIPEFVDKSCGILVPPEDAVALAEGVARLYESPALFDRLSKAATQRILQQRASTHIVEQEIALTKPSSDRISDERPISFISFDVEALPGRAAQDHFERLVWGCFNGGEYGIRRISRILKQYNIKGNFLIDFSACLLYGDKAVKESVDFLLSEGHEVHVHLHPEWCVRKWGLKSEEWASRPVGMDVFDDSLSHSMLHFAAFKYRLLVGKAPVLFRAGAFRFNASTIEVARNLGYKACSNFNSIRHAGTWTSQNPVIVNNEPFRWKNGLFELPVDFSPEPLSHGWEIYQGSFDRVLARKGLKTFNLTLHSWSLLTREGGGHFTGYCPSHEERLHTICRHLKANTRPMGYAEYLSAEADVPEETDCRCLTMPKPFTNPTKRCTICGATYGMSLNDDICPSCQSRARHRQILDVLNRIGNPFDGRSVLACHANPVELQVFLSKAAKVINFDVRPLGYADLQMDIQSMDKVGDSSFDTFLAIHVLNHVADDTKALKEIHRVLKPRGIALITVPCRENSSTEDCANVVEHYGQDALDNFGVGTYRRYGLHDMQSLFSQFFSVERYDGFDELSSSRESVFWLTAAQEAN